MSEYDSMSFSLSPEGNCKNDKVQMPSINLVCPVCDAGYIDKKEFYSHLRIHAGDVLLKQVQCLKKDENDESETEPEYSSQQKIVDNFYENILRPFKCQQCELTFDRASQYDYHHRSIHLGEKSQLCEICGKSFFRKTDLRTHLNIHLGTNQCICEICGKRFNHISNLIRHCRMHTGVKLYPCSICGKRFTQISSLARHKRIHERKKNDAMFQSSSSNGSSEKKESTTTSRNKFVEGSTSNLQKVVKRQHYCKICGESFNFIFLLREHEKSHSRSSECTNDATSFQKTIEFKDQQQQPVDNISFLESETNVRTASPLDTIIYITSEQLKKINLENIEDSGNCVSPKNLCDEKLLPDGELNVSDKITFDNEETPLVHNNPFLLCKSDESVERDNLSYICQDEDVHKSKLCPDMCEPNLDKSEPILNYDTLISSSVNVTDMFQRIDLSEPDTDDINLNCDPSLHKNDEANSLAQNEKLPGELNDVNNIANQDEPMLRLVQTETGEQFYEFLINNLVEKLPKMLESKSESINLNEENHQEQSLRDDINNELNYSQYELQGDEKSFSANQILLDTQTDFEKYVESNFEVFERLNYDDSPDRFLEFVETAGLSNPSTKISECTEESEQFLQFQNFGPIDAVPESEKNYTVNNDNENGNGGIVETDEKQEQPSEGSINNNEQSKNEQDLKKLKTFLIKFQCTVCEKSFSTSYNYKQHIGTHFADQQKFHCKDCNMSFAWKSTLNKHIANNHRPEGPQKFACDICNKIYNTSSQVNEHVKRDHLKQRNHVCSQCGKSFFKKYDLKIHNRIHTDERPYVCRACGKRFHHRSHIVRHERIHF